MGERADGAYFLQQGQFSQTQDLILLEFNLDEILHVYDPYEDGRKIAFLG